MLSGFGSVVAETVTASIVGATTALEYPANASGPGVRCATDTDTGIGRDASNQMTIWSGGTAVARGLSGAGFSVLSGVELSALGMAETRDRERRSWRTAVTVAAATQIPITGAMRVRVDPSGGAVVSTAAPLFSGSPGDGDEITLVNVNASNSYTLNHHGNAGVNSKLLLRGGTTRVLGAAGGYIHLKYQASDDRFYEIGFGT